jgi:ADP-ribose pyrophosphatase YjhB (NUDIX family)
MNSKNKYKYNNNKSIKNSNSYGIICCKKNKITQKNEILFIKKKNTYAYISFIKGIYTSEYDILKLFNLMTLDEKLTILSFDFKLIWYKCFLSYSEFDRKTIKLKKKFDKLKNKNNGEYITNLIKKSNNIDLIYEIPKGHINKNESNINAAIREFYEETHIHKGKYKILYDVKPFIYSFIDDNVKYNYFYYIAVMLDQSYIPRVNYNSEHMLYETCDIKFLSLDYIKLINNDPKFTTMLKTVLKIAKKYIIQ